MRGKWIACATKLEKEVRIFRTKEVSDAHHFGYDIVLPEGLDNNGLTKSFQLGLELEELPSILQPFPCSEFSPCGPFLGADFPGSSFTNRLDPGPPLAFWGTLAFSSETGSLWSDRCCRQSSLTSFLYLGLLGAQNFQLLQI